MLFSDFAGNEKVKDNLTRLIQSGRLPHAVVLEGAEGLGKRTLAKALALELFCRNSDGGACRQCSQCSKAIQGIHPDLYEYTAPGSARSFSVDKVRQIREDAFIRPNEADYKIYILGNCQCMSEQAQNALLKILEEPPSYAIFILTVDTKSALLETVLSRSAVFTLEGTDSHIGAEYICSHCENIDYETAENAVSVWGGNIGKAIDSLSDGKLSKINEIACNICNALTDENEYALLTACSVFERDRDTLTAVCSVLKTIFRDAMLIGDNGGIMSGQREIAQALSYKLSREKLLKLIYACDNIRVLAVKNGNNAILITKICYELRRAQNR